MLVIALVDAKIAMILSQSVLISLLDKGQPSERDQYN